MIPWRREWLLTPVFWPGEFHGKMSLAGYSPWGCKESDMTKQLSLSPPVCTLCPFVQLISIFEEPMVYHAQVRHTIGNWGGESNFRSRDPEGQAVGNPQSGCWSWAGDPTGVVQKPHPPEAEGLRGWPSSLQAFPKIYRRKLSLPVAQNC